MKCSLDIWPTSSNPASFIPAVVDYYPLEIQEDPLTFTDNPPEICPQCHRILDSQTVCESDRIQCCWCSKVFKPNDLILLSNQLKCRSIIYRKPASADLTYALILCFDTCNCGSYIQLLKSCIISSISSLAPSQPFFLCIIRGNYSTYIFVKDSTILTFDLPYEVPIWKYFNLKSNLTTSKDLPALKPLIDQLSCDVSSKRDVDCLYRQVTGDQTIFSQILLFSAKGPSSTFTSNCFVNWISPAPPLHKPSIEGLFLDASAFKADELQNQITYLIEKLTKEDTLFNFNINAYITNYRCVKSSFSCSTAMPFFCQSFQLKPTRLSQSTIPSQFGIETTFLRFTKTGVFSETKWESRSFSKSLDFIPVAAGVDALLLIPHLLLEGELTNFVNKLMEAYQKHCLSQLAGDDVDNTFSTLPGLQWFLRADIEGWGGSSNLIYGNRFTTLSLLHPRVCFWKDFQTCIQRGCQLEMLFYSLIGSPSIVIIEGVDGITVFSDSSPAPEDSNLGKELKSILESRFPKPKVNYLSLTDLKSRFPDQEKLHSLVNQRFKIVASEPSIGRQ